MYKERGLQTVDKANMMCAYNTCRTSLYLQSRHTHLHVHEHTIRTGEQREDNGGRDGGREGGRED